MMTNKAQARQLIELCANSLEHTQSDIENMREDATEDVYNTIYLAAENLRIALELLDY